MKAGTILSSCLIILVFFFSAHAQEIMLDEMERAGGLVLFQEYGDPGSWYYLADRPRIAEADGRTLFSFMKFVTNEDTGGEGGTTTAQGGGIVHFLVEFHTPEDVVREAEQELQRRVSNARIKGPIIYRSGTFSLVSTILDEDGDYTSKVIGLGKAPIMEGHKAAVSILLTREGATLLWENFKMDTPDISLQFEMTVSGYRTPFEAELTGDWSLIAKNRTIAIGLSTPVIGLDVQNSMKELRQSGAIVLKQKGSDEASERFINLVEGKLVELIFEQANSPTVTRTLADDPNLYSNFQRAARHNAEERERVRRANENPPRRMGVGTPRSDYPAARPGRGGSGGNEGSGGSGRGSGRSGAGSSPYNLEANRENPPSFSLLASYRVKQLKSSGTFRLTFNKSTLDTLVFPISENVGPLFGRFGDDPSYFREVNLDDEVYKQREVIVFLDGQDASDFTDYVNYVSVALRKEHQNGGITTDEVRIDKNNFQETGNIFRLLYGWKGDRDRDRWLHYRYKTFWSFHGGTSWEGEWQDTDNFNITVAPPHRYRTIQLEADPDILAEEGVRLTTIDFYYDFLGTEKRKKVTMRSRPADLNKTIEYSHAPGAFDYEYEIVWRLRGGKTLRSGRMTGSDEVIFCDELPEE